MTEFNPNCGKCGMLNSRGFCSLTACRFPSNVIAIEPKVIRGMMVNPQVGEDKKVLTKRTVYRGDVYNAIEAERINHLDGILSDRYKEGFHDGLKRALEILANDVKDVEGE